MLVNALYIVVQRVQKIHRPTGIDEQNILIIDSSGFTERFQEVPSVQEDLAYLRGVSGVIVAAAANSIPLSSGGNNDQLVTRPEGRRSDYYNQIEIDEQGLDALGLRLVAGRNFRHDEIEPPLTKMDATRFVAQIIVSRALAEHLFPQQNTLGKTVYNAFNHSATS